MRIVFTITFCLIIASLFGQMLPVKNYNTKDGLTQNQIIDIYKDKKGFIWFLTQGGASKFDGRKFENYTVANGLTENALNGMYDDDGVLYFIGAESFAVIDNNHPFRYDQNYFKAEFDEEIIDIATESDSNYINVYVSTTKELKKYNHRNKSFDTALNFSGMGIEVDDNISCIFLTDNIIQIHTNIDSKTKAYLVDLKKKEFCSWNEDNFRTIYNEDDYSGFIQYEDSIFFHYTVNSKTKENVWTYCNPDRGVFKEFLRTKDSDFVHTWDKKEIFHDGKNRLWMYDKNGQIYAFDLETQTIEKLKMQIKHSVFKDAVIRNALVYLDDLIFATSEGLFEYDMNLGVTRLYNTTNGFSNNNINVLDIDKEGNIWLGTNGAGIDKMNRGKISNYTVINGLPNSGTNNIVESRDGTYWISTDDGVARIMKDGSIRSYTTENGLTHNDAWALDIDHNNTLWVGTYNGGINSFNGKRFVNRVPSSLKKSTSYVTEIFTDSDGSVWVQRDDKMIKFYGNRYKVFDFGEDYGIYQIEEDKDGYLWMASADKGLIQMNKQGQILNEYSPDPKFFSSTMVGLVSIDEDNIWCATYGEGIAVFNKKSRTYTGMIVEPFKDAEIIKSMVKDDKGHIWIGTINGIFEYDGKSYTYYSEVDGMIANATRTTGAYKDIEGKLWFSSSFGVMTIDPEVVVNDTIPPVVLITDFNADKGLPVPNEESEYVFTYDNNNLTFEFIALDYKNPENVRFQYQLLNFDSFWSDKTEETKIRYTNLNAGRYTFMLKAIDMFGNESSVLKIPLRVKPPFWKTIWFILIEIAGSVLIVFAVFRHRTKALQKRTEELEKEVSARTVEVKEKNEQIMSSIRYSERIQHAFLPQEERINQQFSECFAYYKPRDIIAGDFYWTTEIDDYDFFAVVDCTGHGVPGALLSVIGHMLLTEIIRQEKILDPAEILHKMHQDMQRVLKQTEENAGAIDGMEVCLIRLDKNRESLCFAGAGRPLYAVRKIDGHIEFDTIKGSKKGIGGRTRKIQRKYTNTDIKLNNNDMFYLTTDGFVDQANSENKKFGSRRLKDLLVSLYERDMFIQSEKINKAFIRHRGSEKQRDDITIVGIRIKKDKI